MESLLLGITVLHGGRQTEELSWLLLMPCLSLVNVHWSLISLISRLYFWGSFWQSLRTPYLMSCCMVLPLGLEIVERFRAFKGQNRGWSYWDFASLSVMEITPVPVVLHWRGWDQMVVVVARPVLEQTSEGSGWSQANLGRHNIDSNTEFESPSQG